MIGERLDSVLSRRRPAYSGRIHLCRIALALAVLVGGRHQARAEASIAPSLNARQHFAQGELHYNVGEFARALDRYRQAYKLAPLVGLQFNMAQCYRHLGRWRLALFQYRRYLSRAIRLSAAHRAEVESFIGECEERLRQAERRRAASLPVMSRVTVPAARTKRPPAATAIAVSKRGEARSRWRLGGIDWLGLGATVVLVAVGTTTGVIALGKRDRYLDGRTPVAEADALKADGQAWARASTASWIGAATAAVATLAWYFYRRGAPSRSAARDHALSLLPRGLEVRF